MEETSNFDYVFAPALNQVNPYTNASANTPNREDLIDNQLSLTEMSHLLDLSEECCDESVQVLNAFPKYGCGKGKTLVYPSDCDDEYNDVKDFLENGDIEKMPVKKNQKLAIQRDKHQKNNAIESSSNFKTEKKETRRK
ncbi:ORF-15 [Buzura suppressaria nucleopolyhedrovirus]|uniref:ORF-15 n=1 Tax=Buzura suppressaria nuclear polyhedrosis virus TaxID=74320 RepID=W5VKY0_NPVBS|nr:ORF-15 [Buzura suppressaria nucleopolyhedrovirus]AHH82604.1 ORF-15 [Buzura suppressaria nucleopolyhedrovirus]